MLDEKDIVNIYIYCSILNTQIVYEAFLGISERRIRSQRGRLLQCILCQPGTPVSHDLLTPIRLRLKILANT